MASKPQRGCLYMPTKKETRNFHKKWKAHLYIKSKSGKYSNIYKWIVMLAACGIFVIKQNTFFNIFSISLHIVLKAPKELTTLYHANYPFCKYYSGNLGKKLSLDIAEKKSFILHRHDLPFFYLWNNSLHSPIKCFCCRLMYHSSYMLAFYLLFVIHKKKTHNCLFIYNFTIVQNNMYLTP